MRVLIIQRAYLLAALLDLGSQLSDLYHQRGLLGIHLGDPAGQYHAQPGAHLFAQRGIALGFHGLPFERTHLPRDFFEDVVDTRQVLLGLFQAKLRKPLPGFETSDSGRLFDNRAPVMGLGTEQLPDALLLDNGVGFRA